MSIFSLANCLIGHHKPVRRNVRWDSGAYVGDCRHCGKPIRRITHGNWRAHRT